MLNETLPPKEGKERLVQILEKLEPVFVKAGELALSMQGVAKHHNKYDTGNDLVDIVTEADLAVQEFLLTEIRKTELVNCRLLGEENTPQTSKFNEQGKFYLSIDPIDGTANYAKGNKFWSVIITFHDGRDILYMFNYFPALKFTQKIANNQYFSEGELPEFPPIPDTKDMIVYWSGNPKEMLPLEVYEDLIKRGIIFKDMKDMEYNDSATLLAENRVAGAYAEDTNVYDGVVNLAIAQAKNMKIFTGGPEGFSLSNIKKRESGFYYPGYYLALSV